jgi:hypothetical protein
VTNPIDQPWLYDYITLDDEKIAVLVKRTGGFDREQVVEQQQSPGYAGAYTVVKQEKLIEGTYRFMCWEPAHFTTMGALIARFNAGKQKRPPRVYRLGDPAVAHNQLKQIVIGKISPLIEVSHSPIMYAYDIGVYEYRKRKPIGGVAVPEKTATDKQIELVAAQNAALQGQLDALAKAQSTGAP